MSQPATVNAVNRPSPSDASPRLTQRSAHGDIVTVNLQELERLIRAAGEKKIHCEHAKRSGSESRARYGQQLEPIQAYLDYLDKADERQELMVGIFQRRGQYGLHNAIDSVDLKLLQERAAKLKSLIAGIDQEALAADAQIAMLDADVALLNKMRSMNTQYCISEAAARSI